MLALTIFKNRSYVNWYARAPKMSFFLHKTTGLTILRGLLIIMSRKMSFSPPQLHPLLPVLVQHHRFLHLHSLPLDCLPSPRRQLQHLLQLPPPVLPSLDSLQEIPCHLPLETLILIALFPWTASVTWTCVTWRVIVNEMKNGDASLEIWNVTWSGCVNVNDFYYNQEKTFYFTEKFKIPEISKQFWCSILARGRRRS